jgi:hypothetical protein
MKPSSTCTEVPAIIPELSLKTNSSGDIILTGNEVLNKIIVNTDPFMRSISFPPAQEVISAIPSNLKAINQHFSLVIHNFNNGGVLNLPLNGDTVGNTIVNLPTQLFANKFVVIDVTLTNIQSGSVTYTGIHTNTF